MVVAIARQIENIAIRMVLESTVINKEAKAHFLRNIFYADENGKKQRYGENGGKKTHEWFLKAVMGTGKAQKIPDNDLPDTSMPSTGRDPLDGFLIDGTVPDRNIFKALPSDPYLANLAKLLKDDVVGNIILAARKAWFRGYAQDWGNMPNIPTAQCMQHLLSQLARELDTETAANVTRNFLRYQEHYIKKQLEPLLATRPELNVNKIAELVCMKIDQLPLDGRDDLQAVDASISSKSMAAAELEVFVNTERKKLSRWIGATLVSRVDVKQLKENEVDIGFALGFGEKKCVQVDYLVPAIIEMARIVNMPVTVIPEPAPTNRVIQFDIDTTKIIIKNLDKFAESLGLDIEVAKRTQERLEGQLKLVKDGDMAHDLHAIKILFDVGIVQY